MARVPGAVGLSTNYELSVSKPMDARIVVPTKDDLLLFGKNIYKGMIVSIQDGSGDVYTLLDPRYASSADFSGWKKVGEGSGSAPDLSDYYTKSEVDGLVDGKVDQSYVDEKILEVSNKVDSLEIPSIEGLATTDQLEEVRGSIPSVEGLATTSQLEQVRSEIPVVEGKYTPVSDFNALSDKVNGIVVPETGHLATKEELATVEGKIPTDYAKKSDLNNYYDKSTVDQKLAEVVAGGEINLDGYAVKAEVEAELAKKADQSAVDASVTELRGSIQSVSEGLASKAPLTTTNALNTRITEVAESVTAVDEKVDALQIPDESKLATKEEVAAVDEKVEALDFTPYAKTADVELALADKLESDDLAPYAKSEDVNAALTEKADASELSKYATTTKVEEVESEVDTVTDEVAVIKRDYITTTSATQIAENAATAAIVGLVEAKNIPELVAANIPNNVVRDGDIADMATKAHVSATYLSQENASATYVTKEAYNLFVSGAATDAEVTSAVNTAKAELSGRIDNLEAASATHITKDVTNLTNYMKTSEISSTYATKTELNEIADIFVGADGETVSLSDYATIKYVDAEISEHRSETYTKTETDGKIAAAVASDKVAVLDSSGKIDDDVLPNVVTTAITWGAI